MVPCLVPIHVVHFLELVEIQKHQAERPLVPLSADQFNLEMLFKGPPVEAVGRKIDVVNLGIETLDILKVGESRGTHVRDGRKVVESEGAVITFLSTRTSSPGEPPNSESSFTTRRA